MSRARRRRRPYDPWRARGWRTPGHRLRAAGVLLFVSVLVTGLAAAMFLSESWRASSEERRYVVATGIAGEPVEGIPQVVVSAPEIGSMPVPVWWLWEWPEPGERVTLLVGRTDPSDYLDWEDRARPGFPLVALAGGIAITGALAGMALAHARRGRLDVSGILANAVPVTAATPTTSLPWNTASDIAFGAPFALALSAVAVTAAALVLSPAPARPVVRTTAGTVVVDSRGSYGLRFYDERIDTEWDRPMTSREAAGHRDGDAVPVTYVADGEDEETGPLDSPWLRGAATVAVLSLVALLRRRWHRDVAAAAEEPPLPVPVVAWRREAGGTDWLAVAPPGATRVADVLLVPLTGWSRVPDAMEGTLTVRGTLRRGRAVVLYGPDGATWWPAGRVRGPFAATLFGPSPSAPVPPRR